MPVTHRIVDIASVPDDAQARRLTLKGDDNDAVDSDSYVVVEAGRVVASAPGVGVALLWSRSPAALIAATVLVAAIVAWALWPSGRRDRGEPASARAEREK